MGRFSPFLVSKRSPLLLDLFPNSEVAYSFRKLRLGYTGNCIRVRRSSDNAEQNIGFVNNQLDTASLLAFCGAGNGFVTTWYDQSTNGNNATQTTAANQPQIVSNGNLILENTKPAIIFNPANRTFLESSIITTKPQPITRIAVSKANSGYILDGNSRGILGISEQRYRIFAGIISDYNNLVTNTQKIWFARYGGPNLSNLILNGTPLGNRDVGNLGFNQVFIGGHIIDTLPSVTRLDGNIQEIIIYPSDQTTNRTGIETNINSHYNIYP